MNTFGHISDMNDLIDQLPWNHFGEVMEKAAHYLQVGESVLIYGMSSGGDNHFLRMIKRRIEEGKEIKTIFIECRAYPFGLLDKLKSELVKVGGGRVMIILSHIDEVVKKQREVFTYLLALRIQNPTKLVVLSSCSSEILLKEQEYFEVGEILFGSLLKIPLFDFEGTKRILLTNQIYFGFKYEESDFKKIYELSGGHPGLVKHIGKAVDDWGRQVLENPELLVSYPSVAIKLRELARETILLTHDNLMILGLLNEKSQIFSHLLKIYLQKYEAENVEALLPGLTVQDRKIFSYLLINKGALVDTDKISFLMGLDDETFSMWAVYKAVSRLKKKLAGKYRLEAVKGKGYQCQKVESMMSV